MVVLKFFARGFGFLIGGYESFVSIILLAIKTNYFLYIAAIILFVLMVLIAIFARVSGGALIFGDINPTDFGGRFPIG